MKTFQFLILIVTVIVLFSCGKNESEEINSPDVETYIELLKTNQYESLTLPEFSSHEIPVLLEYINDNTIVNKFPHHPASSYAPPYPDYRLGVLVLWTIETVRVAACNEKHWFGFPSQHPFVQTKSEPVEWIINHEDKVYDSVRQAYLNWWNDNENKRFNNFCNIDPLANTKYRWH